MKKILSKMLNVLSFILMFASFALILIGILFTYKRLEKSLVEAINIFIPFILVIFLTVINMFNKKAKTSENLLFNFTKFLVFIVIIIIGLRAKFDTNMLLYQKYQINYNPNYLADNLSTIKVLLYCLSGANVFILFNSLLKEKKLIVKQEDIKEEKAVFLQNKEQISNNTEEL
ncbi:MAG: hypothetical protein PUC23_00980 [bacterium]|nr:hypothetical protein [bacterium]